MKRPAELDDPQRRGLTALCDEYGRLLPRPAPAARSAEELHLLHMHEDMQRLAREAELLRQEGRRMFDEALLWSDPVMHRRVRPRRGPSLWTIAAVAIIAGELLAIFFGGR